MPAPFPAQKANNKRAGELAGKMLKIKHAKWAEGWGAVRGGRVEEGVIEVSADKQ